MEIVLFLLCFAIGKSIQSLPPGFKTCKVKDANFQTCLNTAIEDAVKSLKNGLPDFNLPPLDPHLLKSLQIGAGDGAVHLTQNYKDLSIIGLADVIVNNSHVDFDKKTLSFSTMHPHAMQKAHYDVNGQILMLPVHGNGPCTLELMDLFSYHRLEFDENKKEGDTFYTIKKYDFKWNPKSAKFQFDNLFDGNKLLGDNINKIINEEWRIIMEDVGKSYEQRYSEIFFEYSKGIFAKVPINQIFMQ